MRFWFGDGRRVLQLAVFVLTSARLKQLRLVTSRDLGIICDLSVRFCPCCVDDLVEGIWRLMATEDGFCGSVNLGNAGEFTIRQLAELVIALTGSRSELVTQPLPSDDPKQRAPDLTIARARLGWSPALGLEEGLKRTIAYFRSFI
jgi:UDP-glucuronate decarboxylase